MMRAVMETWVGVEEGVETSEGIGADVGVGTTEAGLTDQGYGAWRGMEPCKVLRT